VTRRELVTVGALGAWSATASGETAGPAAEAGAGAAQSPESVSAQALRDIALEMGEIKRLLREGLTAPSLNGGVIVEVRRQFGLFLRANQKYPDFCEIGPGVFTELYDWHVRHRQPIEITRTDNRLTIRFMFTGMVLRPEQDPAYVGTPFDPA
jgi:hypothetical protein